MQRLWPEPLAGEITDADLERLYAYPENPTDPWVQVNFVSSADGAVTIDNKSEGLSHPADKRVFLLGRDLADVILVGAGTVRTEGYNGWKPGKARRERRERLGLSRVPPIAVVTGSANIDPASPLLTDTWVPPIIITTARAPEKRRAALAEAGAQLIIAGEQLVDLRVALTELAHLGLRRIDCEGGPHLFGELIAEDLVDQLCLTISPNLVGGGPDRIALGRLSSAPRRLELASILHEDGFTMMRYRRAPDR
ncbi:pyrimidine reductase family protein [Amycolatopsis anabasis]|uniref:pyrimidine reductase family protein n=1 Tax=Amycolatopsis anabasis TaxID=1840409 RepID=UPI00131C7324|nr:pyrimidine reductase family protein [Amycolatopsis anabasis]